VYARDRRSKILAQTDFGARELEVLTTRTVAERPTLRGPQSHRARRALLTAGQRLWRVRDHRRATRL